MTCRSTFGVFAACALVFALALPAAAKRRPATHEAPAAAPRVSVKKAGTIRARPGLRLRLTTDLGNIRIFTDSPDEVRYNVTAEADARESGAEKFLNEFTLAARAVPSGAVMVGHVPWKAFRGQIWVNYEIHLPRRFHVDASTQAGNIELQDIDGRVLLVTAGGNITAGNIGVDDGRTPRPAGWTSGEAPLARLETQGGHIVVGDVAGDLRATTAGGHITTGNIDGDAVLRTGGGHIHTGRVSGVAQLDTGGGNIHVADANSTVTASTVGGQIDFGDAEGTIHAQTGGGAVRIERVSGPTQVESAGGAIFLRRVEGPLHATTATGNITAWFIDSNAPRAIPPPDGTAPAVASVAPATPAHPVAAPPAPFALAFPRIRQLSGGSQLESGQGDIIVYIPRELAVTIEANIEQGAEHRITADPALPLKISYDDSASGGRTVHGECSVNGGGEVLRLKAVSGNIILKLGEPPAASAFTLAGPALAPLALQSAPAALAEAQAQMAARIKAQADEQQQEGQSRFEDFARKFEAFWWGGVPVAPEEQQKHLVYSITPVYPEAAQRAGLEGIVVLRAYIGEDGRVADLRVVSGHPLLAEAAVQAVKQWRYQPLVIDGRTASVVTTVTLAFRLQ